MKPRQVEMSELATVWLFPPIKRHVQMCHLEAVEVQVCLIQLILSRPTDTNSFQQIIKLVNEVEVL